LTDLTLIICYIHNGDASTQALPPSDAECLEIWKPQTSGILRVRPGQHRDSLFILLHVL